MSIFLPLFKSSLRTQLASRRTWLLMLLLPLMTYGTTALLPAREVSTTHQDGRGLTEQGRGA